MRWLLACLISLMLASVPAAASTEPTIAATPDWVEAVDIPAPDRALASRPVQALLFSVQSRYEPDLHVTYYESAALVQNSQGLADVGNINLPWQPEHTDLVVHRARILRNGAVIDLLANGQQFTVLRRENNLESATLDGVLTAVLQPEGLAVGDVLHVAYSIRRRASAIPLRADGLFWANYGSPVRQVLLRDVWREGIPVQWRTAASLGRARTRTGRFGSELVLSVEGYEAPRPVENAPPRFLFADSHQVSGYRSWSEISAMLAPLYHRASQLRPDSPLRREIERIAAASTDPASRALAALRTVQDDIRYFALAMGDGGYVPASADQTWTRRFGDCKGKTAVLLALLAGLGIESEPVLVSTIMGDGLNDRLPTLNAFNHVIVRARIGGRSYWLDGTRIGDRDLAELASSLFGWGLPLRSAGAALEEMPWASPVRPISEVNVAYDASAGFDRPLPTRTEMTFRGDLATEWRLAAQRNGVADVERMFRESYRDVPEGERPTEIRFRENADGSVTVTAVSSERISWERAPASSAYRSRFGELPVDNLGQLLRIEADRRIPLLLPLAHNLITQSVILPNGGAGYSTEGADFAREIAGTRAGRQLKIEAGRLVARAWFRTAVREVPAAEIRAQQSAIEALAAERAWLRAPVGFRPAETATAAVATSATAAVAAARQQAEEHVERGYALMQEGRAESAIAEFDRAVALAPDWSRPQANRGVALVHRNRFDDAERALAAAARLDDRDFVVHQGRGFLALRRGRPEEAIEALTRSLELDPRNMFNLGLRAEANAQLGRLEESLRDADAAIAARPDLTVANVIRARLLVQLGRRDEAVLALARLAELNSDDPMVARTRAQLLERVGLHAEASAARAAGLRSIERMTADSPADSMTARLRMVLLVEDGRARQALAIADTALRRQPDSVRMLAARCEVRAVAGIELPLALSDCNRALGYDGGDEDAMIARALTHMRLQRWADAAADFGQVISWSPGNAAALYGRGIARLRLGDRENGERDLAAARRYLFDVASDFERMGIRP